MALSHFIPVFYVCFLLTPPFPKVELCIHRTPSPFFYFLFCHKVKFIMCFCEILGSPPASSQPVWQQLYFSIGYRMFKGYFHVRMFIQCGGEFNI